MRHLLPLLLSLAPLTGCALIDGARIDALFSESAGDDGSDGSDGTPTDSDDGTDATDGSDGSDGSDGTDGTDATDSDDGTDATDGTDTGEPPAAPCDGFPVWGSVEAELGRPYTERMDFDTTAPKLNLDVEAHGLSGSIRFEADGPGRLYAVTVPGNTALAVGLYNREGRSSTITHLVAILESCPLSDACEAPEETAGPCLGAVSAGLWSQDDSDEHVSWTNPSAEDRVVHVLIDSNSFSGIERGEVAMSIRSAR